MFNPSDVAGKIHVTRSALTSLDLLPLPGCAAGGGAGPDGGMAGGGCFSRASTSLFSCSAASERTPGCWSALTLGATGCCGPAASLTGGAVAPPCSAKLAGAAAGCAVTSAIRGCKTPVDQSCCISELQSTMYPGGGDDCHTMLRMMLLTYRCNGLRPRDVRSSCEAAQQRCACKTHSEQSGPDNQIHTVPAVTRFCIYMHAAQAILTCEEASQQLARAATIRVFDRM